MQPCSFFLSQRLTPRKERCRQHPIFKLLSIGPSMGDSIKELMLFLRCLSLARYLDTGHQVEDALVKDDLHFFLKAKMPQRHAQIEAGGTATDNRFPVIRVNGGQPS